MLKLNNNWSGIRQSGMASIMVVGVMVILLSLVTVGFARLMNRELSQSLNNQLATSANYAAESALNDTINLLKADPTITADDCDDLLNPTDGKLKDKANLSAGAIADAKYTCILIDNNVSYLEFSGATGRVPAFKSQIVKLVPDPAMSSMLLTWQATDLANHNALPASGSTLFDETAWGNGNGTSGYAPILRVTLYPVRADENANFSRNAAKTFFFYPTNNNGSIDTINFTSEPDASLKPVRCGNINVPPGIFNLPADSPGIYQCGVVINQVETVTVSGVITAVPTYFARITSIYTDSDVRIMGNTPVPTRTAVSFVGGQANIDVTAKSTGAVKRLQARVDISQNRLNVGGATDSLPEFSLRSAFTVCKRFLVPPIGYNLRLYVDSPDQAACGLTYNKQPPPTVVTSPAQSITSNSATISGTINPNGIDAYYWFLFSNTPTNASGCASAPAGSPFTPNDSVTRTYSSSRGGLSPSTVYHYRLCAKSTNIYLTDLGVGADVTFTTSP